LFAQAITFSNRAARDMRAKLSSLRPGCDTLYGLVTIKTFHALALQVLREIGHFNRSVSILQSSDQKQLMKLALQLLACERCKVGDHRLQVELND